MNFLNETKILYFNLLKLLLSKNWDLLILDNKKVINNFVIILCQMALLGIYLSFIHFHQINEQP